MLTPVQGGGYKQTELGSDSAIVDNLTAKILEDKLFSAKAALNARAAAEKAFVGAFGKIKARALISSIPDDIWQAFVGKLGPPADFSHEMPAIEHAFTKVNPDLEPDEATNKHPLLEQTVGNAQNAAENQMVGRAGKTRAELGLEPKVREAPKQRSDIQGDFWIAGEDDHPDTSKYLLTRHCPFRFGRSPDRTLLRLESQCCRFAVFCCRGRP